MQAILFLEILLLIHKIHKKRHSRGARWHLRECRRNFINYPQISKIEYNEVHLDLRALINIKQTRPGMSMTEKIALVIDVPWTGLLLKNSFKVGVTVQCLAKSRHKKGCND